MRPRVPHLPLYDVIVPGLDEARADDLTYASAAIYAAALDTTGIPSIIRYSRTVTHDEWRNNKSGESAQEATS